MSAVEFVLLVVKDGDIAFCFKNVIKVQGFCYFMTKTLHKLLDFIFLKRHHSKGFGYAQTYRFGMAEDGILQEIMEQFHLEEQEALAYLQE